MFKRSTNPPETAEAGGNRFIFLNLITSERWFCHIYLRDWVIDVQRSCQMSVCEIQKL